jgi:hypothetical protein
MDDFRAREKADIAAGTSPTTSPRGLPVIIKRDNAKSTCPVHHPSGTVVTKTGPDSIEPGPQQALIPPNSRVEPAPNAQRGGGKHQTLPGPSGRFARLDRFARDQA